MRDANLESPTYKNPHDLRDHARHLLQTYVADHVAEQQSVLECNDVTAPLHLEDVWGDTWAEGEVQWQDDVDAAQKPQATFISRRALFGLPNTHEGTESNSESLKKPTKKRRYVHMAVAGMIGVASTFTIGQILSSDETTASVLPNRAVIDTTVVPATTELPVETTVVTSTVAPASTTTLVATTTIPTTLAPETTVPIVIEIPPTTVTEETAPLIAVSLYDTLDCSQPTMIVQAGMTFSEIAEHCGMTMSRLQSYNPTIDPNHFITGTKLNLRMPAGANPVNDNPKDCTGIGGVETVIQKGFSPIDYLKSTGLSEDAVNSLVYDKGILQKFGLATVIAGTKECLPTRSAIKTLYGL